MTLMRVKALSHNPDAQGAALVLETLTGRLALGLLLPLNEANRLARVLGLTPCRCAPIYQLVLDLVARLRVSVARAVLDCEAEGFFATLVLEQETVPFALRCHPADAIGLALRAQAPIYSTAEALAHACPVEPHAHDADHRDVVQWLERVRPDDFCPEGDGEA